jgi:hypothetical protein
MRDNRFIAEHRRGSLKIEQHRQLMIWACACAEHVIPLLCETPDQRLLKALYVAREWIKGNASVKEAMKASLDAHAAARESSGSVPIAVARAIGQAVATAHMADHSIGSALYALRAVNNADGSKDQERKWQNDQLPAEIWELVISARTKKEKHFRI